VRDFCFISDIHENFDIDINPCDFLVCSGDLTYRGSLEELTKAVEYLAKQPAKNIIVIAGNHDYTLDSQHRGYNANIDAEFIKLISRIDYMHYLEHIPKNIDGINFFGSPYTPEFCKWGFAYNDTLTDLWEQVPENTDILVTHGPPYGILDQTRNGNRNVGSHSLKHELTRIKPKVHCFGHIHEARGTIEMDDTIYVNAAICDYPNYDRLREPIYMELDL
jgi:Icc-related predicted phosphoesterase